MISEEQIDWAVRILENPSKAHPLTIEAANKIADAFLRQERQTADWMCQCYISRDIARMAERHYGNRARTR